MNEKILSVDIQKFINEFGHQEVSKLLFAPPVFEEVSNAELAVQIQSKEKCKYKLPTWFHQSGILFPAPLSIEQTSSELTAQLKASWFSGALMIDLTGGFGVDAFYFSKSFEKVIHCEFQSELSELVTHNFKKLQVSHIQCENVNGLDYVLNTTTHFDLIYLDPARRASQGKVFQLKDCEPNFLPYLDELMQKTDQLVIKTSPLLDISLAMHELKYVSEIHINSIKNDAKELVFVLDKNQQAVPEISVHAFHQTWQHLSLNMDVEKNTAVTAYSEPMKYIYEPDVALLKAGWFKAIAQVYKIQKLAQHTHLYTSDTIIPHFIGKIYEVNSVVDFNYLKKNPIEKANILVKNLPMKPEAMAKKYKIAQGGDLFLLAFKNLHHQAQIALVHKI